LRLIVIYDVYLVAYHESCVLLGGILRLLRGIGLTDLSLQAGRLVVPSYELLLRTAQQLIFPLLPLLRLIATYQYASSRMLPVLHLAQVVGLNLMVKVILVELRDFVLIL